MDDTSRLPGIVDVWRCGCWLLHAAGMMYKPRCTKEFSEGLGSAFFTGHEGRQWRVGVARADLKSRPKLNPSVEGSVAATAER